MRYYERLCIHYKAFVHCKQNICTGLFFVIFFCKMKTYIVEFFYINLLTCKLKYYENFK